MKRDAFALLVTGAGRNVVGHAGARGLCDLADALALTTALAVEAGIFSTQWAFLGAYSLGDFPESRVLVAGLWTTFPVVLAVISAINARDVSARRYPKRS